MIQESEVSLSFNPIALRTAKLDGVLAVLSAVGLNDNDTSMEFWPF